MPDGHGHMPIMGRLDGTSSSTSVLCSEWDTAGRGAGHGFLQFTNRAAVTCVFKDRRAFKA